MVRILPCGHQDNDGCIRVDRGEDIRAFALTGNEPVPGLHRMGTTRRLAQLFQGPRQKRFIFFLDRPAGKVGTFAQIGIGNEKHLILAGNKQVGGGGQGQVQHRFTLAE